MTNNKLTTTIALLLILSFTISIFGVLPISKSQLVSYPDRPTAAYIDVNPYTIGTGQNLLVNLWVFPCPSGPNYEGGSGAVSGGHQGFTFNNITVTFSRPDGSKDKFMPLDGSAKALKLVAGETEEVGTMWFHYQPKQLGNWTVSFSFPGQRYTVGNFTVFYMASNSREVPFTVQQEPVAETKDVPLPTEYWTRPINAENREWSQISGGWFGNIFGQFNPYSQAPGSAHILWKSEVSLGGLVGGEWGSLSYPGVSGFGTSFGLISNGRLFVNEVIPGTGTTNMTCYDLKTHKLIWQATGTISAGQMLATGAQTGLSASEFTGSPTPYLWEYGATAWKRYNAYTGALTLNIPKTNITAGYGGAPTWTPDFTVGYSIRQGSFGVAWNRTIPNRLDYNELIKWDFNKWNTLKGDWTNGIVWRISMKMTDGTGPGEGGRGSSFYLINDNMGVVYTMGEDKYYFFDLKTGALLYTRSTGFPSQVPRFSPEGWLMPYDVATRTLYSYDISSWTIRWKTVVGEDPWGTQGYPQAWAYGNTYMGSYDGYVYALNTSTGQLNWKSYLGDTKETPWKTLAPRSWIVADEKIYVSTSEHTPTQPRARDNKVFCFDAITGEQLWNHSGAMAFAALAEGCLIGANEYDGYQYCWGKGQTITSAASSPGVITHGSTVVVEGKVLDVSPASPNTPAISDEDMGTWMNYLHMQKAVLINNPPDVKGVDVSLDAIDPNNNLVHIGTATSDSTGTYGLAFTPQVPGLYKIIVTFAGSESYWSSRAETFVNVEPATATAAPTQAPAQSTADMYFVPAIAGLFVLIIIVLVLVVLIMLKKRP